MPKGVEINEVMTKLYGNYGPKGWSRVQFVCDEEDEEDEDEY